MAYRCEDIFIQKWGSSIKNNATGTGYEWIKKYRKFKKQTKPH